jgi:four helix bundle protein
MATHSPSQAHSLGLPSSIALTGFRTYGLALQFHKLCFSLRVPGHLRNQLVRAASSIVLNLAEGSSKPQPRERARFYRIALGSLRECQAVLDLVPEYPASHVIAADRLGASLYRLCKGTVGE